MVEISPHPKLLNMKYLQADRTTGFFRSAFLFISLRVFIEPAMEASEGVPHLFFLRPFRRRCSPSPDVPLPRSRRRRSVIDWRFFGCFDLYFFFFLLLQLRSRCSSSSLLLRIGSGVDCFGFILVVLRCRFRGRSSL